MSTPFETVTFLHGPAMKNRFMLSPLTNQQSNPDGTLSADEERWLTMRAAGGFGMTMTCASHVDPLGQGFDGRSGAAEETNTMRPDLRLRIEGATSCVSRNGATAMTSSASR